MPHQKTRFAILGAGVAAEFHQNAIKANAGHGAELVALGHHDSDRYGEISHKFEAPCLSYDDVLARNDVDVVCIATPSGQHAAQAIAAAKADKHVLVEKPMALSTEDADQMITACADARVKLGVLLQRRAEPAFKSVKQAIAAGDFGELTMGLVTIPYFRSEDYYAQAAWRGTWDWDGGGVLMNQGIHLIDLLVWYMGEPVAIMAEKRTLHRLVEVEDTLTALLRFANGSMATVTATTTTEPGFPHRIEIYGTQGGVQLEGEAINRLSLANPSQATTFIHARSSKREDDAGAGANPRNIEPSGHIALFKDFIDAIRDNRPPTVDGHEGKKSLETVLKIYSATLNR